MELARVKCNMLSEFQKIGSYRCNYIVEDVAQDALGDVDESPVDARTLDAFYRSHSQEDFQYALMDAALKKDSDRSVWEQALMRPHVSAHLEKLRRERDAFEKARKSNVFMIEGDPRLPAVDYAKDITDSARMLEYDLFNPDTCDTERVTELQVEQRHYRTHAQCTLASR